MNQKGAHIFFSLLLVVLQASAQKSVSSDFVPSSETAQRAFFAGQNNLVKGDLQEAYTCFQTCVEEEPDVAGFHYELGKIELELGRYESSIKHLNDALELEPEHDWYCYSRGLAHIKLENYDEAWGDLMVWFKARQGNLEALDFCAEQFVAAGEIWHAYQAYSYYEDEIAHNLEVRINRLFLVLSSQLSRNKIYSFINDAVKDFPDEPLFLFEEASMLATDGEFSKAIPIFENLTEGFPDFLDSYLALAKCHLASQSGQDIYMLLKKGFKSEDIDPAEKLSLLVEVQNEDQVTELLEIAINAHPDDPRLHHFMAMRHMQFGRVDRARDSYVKAISGNPNSVTVREEYMYVLMMQKDWNTLATVSEEAITYFPLEAIFSHYLGSAYSKLGDHKKAIKAYKGGLAIVYEMPELGGALAQGLAMAYREIGEKEKSFDAFEESLDYYPDPYVMNNYAFFLASDRKNISRAYELSEKANELIPKEPNFLDTHALILHLMNRSEEALTFIQQAQSFLPEGEFPDAVFSEREGDILWELERFDEARLKWNEAAEAGGGMKRLNEKLSRTQ